MKKIALGLAAVIVIGFVGFAILLGNLDSILKQAIEAGGSTSTGVAVTVDEVDLAPTEGRAEIRGLLVGNPDGFQTDHAFSLGLISVDLDIANLPEGPAGPIHLTEVVIEAPQITYELGEAGSNLDVIQRNAQAIAAGGGADAGSSEGADAAEQVTWIIDSLLVRGARAEVSASFLDGETVGVTLPDIPLRNIGTTDNAATTWEVTRTVIDAVTAATGRAVAGAQIPGLDAATGAAQDVLDQTGETLEGVGGAAREGLDNLLGR